MVLAFEIRNNRLGINEQMSVPAEVSFFRWTSLSRRRQEPEAKYLARQFLAAGNTPAVQHPRACRVRKLSVIASHLRDRFREQFAFGKRAVFKKGATG
jgi:hypothetical protein